MKIIKQLVEQIEDELCVAEEYADLALKHKDTQKSLADTYYRLATQELDHSATLHDEAVAQIQAYTGVVPEAMQAVWDWEHEQAIEREKEIRIALQMYRN